MARLVTAGFELGGDAAIGGVSVEPTPAGVTLGTFQNGFFDSFRFPRDGSGPWFGRCVPAVNSTSYFRVLFTSAASRTYFFRAYMQMVVGSPTAAVMRFGTGDGISARPDGANALRLFNDSTGLQIGSTSPAKSFASGLKYYRVELSITLNASSQVSACELRLDGITVASTSGLALTVATKEFQVGAPVNQTSEFDIDDIALNDDQGANQNTFPGEGNIVLLKPTADNAVGAGWTLGTGTAMGGNGFGSVDNTPPIGVADLAAGSDPKQIRNATANANSNYDATLQTYTVAGLLSTDVVTLVVPVVATAAPVATSAKAGTIGVTTNPTIANVNLSAGGTAGAFWSGTAAGAHPTGWKWSLGTVTYNPAVTFGTAPVARITQVTSSTRIAMVEALGMYVEFNRPDSDQPGYLDRRRITRRGRLTRKV